MWARNGAAAGVILLLAVAGHAGVIRPVGQQLHAQAVATYIYFDEVDATEKAYTLHDDPADLFVGNTFGTYSHSANADTRRYWGGVGQVSITTALTADGLSVTGTAYSAREPVHDLDAWAQSNTRITIEVLTTTTFDMALAVGGFSGGSVSIGSLWSANQWCGQPTSFPATLTLSPGIYDVALGYSTGYLLGLRGSGNMSFSMQAVPEPIMTLAPIAVLALLTRRKRYALSDTAA